MKSLALLFLLYVPLSSATCAFTDVRRCKNAAGSISGDYERTLQICNDIQSDLCYCVKQSEDYCIVATSEQKQDFIDECESQYGWSADGC